MFFTRDGLVGFFVSLPVPCINAAVIFISPGSGNHGTPAITLGIFYHGFWIASVWFCIDIEAIPMFLVTECVYFFKRVADSIWHFIQKGGAERITEESIVKVVKIMPESVIVAAALRDRTVDVGVPFQIPVKGMENHDKSGSEIQGFILFEKHT